MTSAVEMLLRGWSVKPSSDTSMIVSGILVSPERPISLCPRRAGDAIELRGVVEIRRESGKLIALCNRDGRPQRIGLA